MNQLAPITASYAPDLIAPAGPRASYRFLEFFTANIRNPHTRWAHARAAREFFDWLAAKGVTQLVDIGSIHVAAYIEELYRARSAPTAKLGLAALEHLFDWMVTGQIMPTNPAAAARGPRHIVRRGKTPVLDPAEARQLIDAIVATTDHRLARPRLDRSDGLFVRAHRRGDQHARRGRVHAEPEAIGSPARERGQATGHGLRGITVTATHLGQLNALSP
jgi:hypothetical protein